MKYPFNEIPTPNRVRILFAMIFNFIKYHFPSIFCLSFSSLESFEMIFSLFAFFDVFSRVMLIPTVAPYLLPLFIEEFGFKFTKLKIILKELTTQEIEKSLKNRSIDIGILAIPLQNKELNEHFLYREPFMVYDCTGVENKEKIIAVESLNFEKLCLLEEGHCLRTQVHDICELSNKHSASSFNYSIESSSMDSLLRITKSVQGITIIPYLASLELNATEGKKVFEFAGTVPVRDIGIVTHHFFVKKKILNQLVSIIQKSTECLLKDLGVSKVINPKKIVL